MKKIWKRMLVAGCAAVMSMTMPGMCVLADEMKEEPFVTEAEVPEESVNSVDSLDEDVTEVVAENIDQEEVEEIVGEGLIQVGDGVTATFDADTGAVEFTSQEGELWRDWVEKLGVSRDAIKSIKVTSGTVYLPADSSGVYYEDYSESIILTIYYLFGGLMNLKSLDLSGFDTSNVTDMSNMFLNCYGLTNLDLSSFTTSNVTDMSKMFYGCSKLTSVNLSSFDTSSVTDMSYMFNNCSNLTSVDLSSFNTSNVEKMVQMFYGCSSLISLDLSGFDTSNVTEVCTVWYEGDRYEYGMFEGCSSLTTLDLSGFDMSHIRDLGAMFQDCNSLTSLNLSRVNTANVENMSEMFWGCSSLANLDLSSFDTSNVTDMSEMFRGCSNLKKVDMSSFDTSNVVNPHFIFYECFPEIIHTPKKTNKSIPLPYKMFDSAGNSYTVVPILSWSIVLGKTQQLAKENDSPVIGFRDVQDLSHPYYNAIYWAAEKGITKGYSDGTFGINRSCTRGEMMMFLWRFAGKPGPKMTSKSPFKDVPTTHTFYKPILWGYQKGITKGYSDGTFGIDRNVSRGEAMMFLWKLKGKKAPKAVSKSPFKDVPMNHAFYKAILWGSQKKITVGYTSGPKKGNFGINDNCTRGQIVTFLYRAQ